MAAFVVYLSIIFSQIGAVDSKFIYTREKLTLLQALDRCHTMYNGTLADIRRLGNSGCLSQPMSGSTDNLFWHGYLAKVMPWMSYEGCFQNIQLSEGKAVHITSVALCHAVCGLEYGSYFAVGEQICFYDVSMDAIMRARSSNCTMCDEHAFCGDGKFVSLYRNESSTHASYLDILLNINTDGKLATKLYDKRDDFGYPIVNFPHLSSNIPQSPAYGVYISQMIRYARTCTTYEDFIYRVLNTFDDLDKQGSCLAFLCSSDTMIKYEAEDCDRNLSYFCDTNRNPDYVHPSAWKSWLEYNRFCEDGTKFHLSDSMNAVCGSIPNFRNIRRWTSFLKVNLYPQDILNATMYDDYKQFFTNGSVFAFTLDGQQTNQKILDVNEKFPSMCETDVSYEQGENCSIDCVDSTLLSSVATQESVREDKYSTRVSAERCTEESVTKTSYNDFEDGENTLLVVAVMITIGLFVLVAVSIILFRKRIEIDCRIFRKNNLTTTQSQNNNAMVAVNTIYSDVDDIFSTMQCNMPRTNGKAKHIACNGNEKGNFPGMETSFISKKESIVDVVQYRNMTSRQFDVNKSESDVASSHSDPNDLGYENCVEITLPKRTRQKCGQDLYKNEFVMECRNIKVDSEHALYSEVCKGTRGTESGIRDYDIWNEEMAASHKNTNDTSEKFMYSEINEVAPGNNKGKHNVCNIYSDVDEIVPRSVKDDDDDDDYDDDATYTEVSEEVYDHLRAKNMR